MKISVIIPARNEAKNIYNVIEQIDPSVFEIIVIDGNSIDSTFEVAKSHPKCTKVFKQLSVGKGAALSRGFIECSGDLVITLDADGSTDPAEIPFFVRAINEGADLAKGSRNIFGGGSDDLTPFRNLGNLFLTTLANLLYGTKWTDIAYGYIAIRRDLLNKLNLSNLDKENVKKMNYGSGFEIETLICCRSAKLGANIKEVPSHERSRWSGSSNLKAIPDGFRALVSIVKEKFY